MSGTFNANANAVTLADQVAMDSALKGVLYSRKLDVTATQHNAFSAFMSDVGMNPRGVSSIFAIKRDLKAGGADSVKFSVMGTPGGPGADGATELTGRTSSSKMKTWQVRVGYHRDAVEYTKDQFDFLSAGGQLESTTLELLGKKMGIHRQNRMAMRLIKDASGNIYRPNNRASADALLATDTLSLDLCSNARARLQRIGGRPIKTTMGPNGSPVNGYLIFGGTSAFLPIRNDDGFQTALSNGHIRGTTNANFTGELIDWQGTPFYECPEVDEDWDDYIGSPMSATGWNNTAFTTASDETDCKFITNSSNTLSQYFQFWRGFAYKFYDDESPSADSNTYYAWACNPDGSRCFVSYTGSSNNGNTILLSGILATAAGGSTLGNKTVGNLSLGTTPTVASNIITPDSNANVPTGFTYSDRVQAGAYLIQANANGVPLGYSYVFGAMAASFAFGRIERAMIEQERDYGFVKGRGYEEIFGTGLILGPSGTPRGYLLVEHAIEHESYPVPTVG